MPNPAPIVNPLVVPMNPIRTLSAQDVRSLDDGELVNIFNYKPGDPGQMAEDFRRMGNKIYLNGVALNDIIKPLKIAEGSAFLNDYAKVAEQSQALEKFIKLYESLSGKPYVNNTNLITHFKLHQNLYLDIASQSPDNQQLTDLVSALRDNLDGFYDRIRDLTGFYKNLFDEHLFNDATDEEKAGLFNFMTTFSHQGGVFYAAYTRIMDAFIDTGLFHSETFNPYNNMGSATIEFDFNDGILKVKEISQIQKLGYGQTDEGERLFNYQSTDPNSSLVDMMLVHHVRHAPAFPDHFNLTVDNHGVAAFIHEPEFWDTVQEKLREAKMIREMKPLLLAYAQAYKKNGHDADLAKQIMIQFPVISQYESVKKVSPRFFNAKEVEHNKYDSIFTVLNKITDEPAREIERKFKDYVAAGVNEFTLAMKLLYRLGHEHTLATLLQPYNKDSLTLDKLIKQSTIEKLYPAIANAMNSPQPPPSSPSPSNR
jgi:hypothetical protein